MRRKRHIEVKQLVQGHTACNYVLDLGSEPGSLAFKTTLAVCV